LADSQRTKRASSFRESSRSPTSLATEYIQVHKLAITNEAPFVTSGLTRPLSPRFRHYVAGELVGPPNSYLDTGAHLSTPTRHRVLHYTRHGTNNYQILGSFSTATLELRTWASRDTAWRSPTRRHPPSSRVSHRSESGSVTTVANPTSRSTVHSDTTRDWIKSLCDSFPRTSDCDT